MTLTIPTWLLWGIFIAWLPCWAIWCGNAKCRLDAFGWPSVNPRVPLTLVAAGVWFAAGLFILGGWLL